MKRIVALILCLCFFVAICGCGKKQNVQENSQTPQSIYVGDGISLACNTADSFNPYKSKTQLNLLISFMFFTVGTVV